MPNVKARKVNEVYEFKHPLLPQLKSYVKAALPRASKYAGGLIHVSDASGGASICYSDGTNWKVLAVVGATVA